MNATTQQCEWTLFELADHEKLVGSTWPKMPFKPEHANICAGDVIEIEWSQIHNYIGKVHPKPVRVKSDFKVVNVWWEREIYTDKLVLIITVKPDRMSVKVI